MILRTLSLASGAGNRATVAVTDTTIRACTLTVPEDAGVWLHWSAAATQNLSILDSASDATQVVMTLAPGDAVMAPRLDGGAAPFWYVMNGAGSGTVNMRVAR